MKSASVLMMKLLIYFGDINLTEVTAISEPQAQVLSNCFLHCHNCDLKILYDVPFP